MAAHCELSLAIREMDHEEDSAECPSTSLLSWYHTRSMKSSSQPPPPRGVVRAPRLAEVANGGMTALQCKHGGGGLAASSQGK